MNDSLLSLREPILSRPEADSSFLGKEPGGLGENDIGTYGLLAAQPAYD